MTADLVMEASNERVTGWGRGASFLERLTKAAAANPADFHPWGTLASYRESRDERDLAFSSLIEALSRGAPAEYAERAARLVRNQLELSTGDDKAFPGPLAKLQSLTMYDDRTSLTRQVAKDLKDFFQGEIFETVIPRNVRLAEAPSHGKPILLYDMRSKGAESYMKLAKEIIVNEQRKRESAQSAG